MNKKCVHIIIRDKFTQGYIDFFNTHAFNWDHYFITFEGKYSLNTNKNIYIVHNYKDIVNKYGKLLDECDRIVVASFFDEATSLLFMNRKNWSKTFIQFWGGDIYRFKIRRKTFIHRIKQAIMKNVIKKCITLSAGVLTLVKGDYDVLKEVFEISDKKHLVVQVPDDFYELNHIDYSKLIERNDENRCRILIGNSSTIENGHIEIFNILHNKINNNTELIVPLSYGDLVYREEVIKKGKELFGEMFKPITEYMNREQYIRLLSSCNVAIFNNNRQQATGNIILLTNLQKKIYLRTDTTMWIFFKENGFIYSKIEDLAKETDEQIFTIDDNMIKNNLLALKNMEENAIKEWETFFEI